MGDGPTPSGMGTEAVTAALVRPTTAHAPGTRSCAHGTLRALDVSRPRSVRRHIHPRCPCRTAHDHLASRARGASTRAEPSPRRHSSPLRGIHGGDRRTRGPGGKCPRRRLHTTGRVLSPRHEPESVLRRLPDGTPRSGGGRSGHTPPVRGRHAHPDLMRPTRPGFPFRGCLARLRHRLGRLPGRSVGTGTGGTGPAPGAPGVHRDHRITGRLRGRGGLHPRLLRG